MMSRWGGEKNGISPSIPLKKTQRTSPTMCRGRGMIWNGRQGVTGAAVEWIHISALGSAHLFFGRERRTKKVMVFKRLE